MVTVSLAARRCRKGRVDEAGQRIGPVAAPLSCLKVFPKMSLKVWQLPAPFDYLTMRMVQLGGVGSGDR